MVSKGLIKFDYMSLAGLTQLAKIAHSIIKRDKN